MYYVLCCVQVYHLSPQTTLLPCTICINTSSVLALYYLYNYWPAWCESGVQMLNPFNYLCTGELPESSVYPVAASWSGVQHL